VILKDFVAENKKRHDSVRYYAFFVAIIFAVLLFILFSFSGFRSSDSNYPAALETVINPNTADIASLVRLPGIGPVRAAEIIKYRNSPDITQPAFRSANDLQNIKGIGPKTVEKFSRHLCFDESEN
jgi:competence ComEA-like helix-hairpin-helix protein